MNLKDILLTWARQNVWYIIYYVWFSKPHSHFDPTSISTSAKRKWYSSVVSARGGGRSEPEILHLPTHPQRSATRKFIAANPWPTWQETRLILKQHFVVCSKQWPIHKSTYSVVPGSLLIRTKSLLPEITTTIFTLQFRDNGILMRLPSSFWQIFLLFGDWEYENPYLI